MQRLEATRAGTDPKRREGACRPGNALELLRAEVPKLEQVTQQLARALGDGDGVGLCNPLQPRGEVRRVADDAPLLRLS